MTRGLVGVGGACRSSLECSGALHCEGSTPTQAGRCAEPLPAGVACRGRADALASYVFERDLDRTHPSCTGECSLVSHRCEVVPARGVDTSTGAISKDAALLGESCRTDFDCQRGGCTTAGVCGPKCAVSMPDAARASALPVLELPRRSPKR